jgi:hypothetical protein
MADNLALKLLVAGIIGAVVGAAAAEKYHFPTGLVYGFSNRPPPYGTRTIGPELGAGEVVEGRGEGRGGPPRVVLVPEWPDLPPPSSPRYRPQRSPAARTTALCWQPYENWKFEMTGRWVPCDPARRSRGG